MLQLFRERRPERLSKGNQPTIIGDVFIHPTANVHPTAVVRNPHAKLRFTLSYVYFQIQKLLLLYL